jgi:hypothetical protein
VTARKRKPAPKPTAAIRKVLSELPTAMRKGKYHGTVDRPIDDPKAYGSICVGDCLAPAVLDGDTVIFSPSTKVEKGMIVLVNFKDGRRSGIKRLVEDPPRPSRPGDELSFPWTLEMENPRKRFFVWQALVESVHAVAGVIRDGKFRPLMAADCGSNKRVAP